VSWLVVDREGATEHDRLDSETLERQLAGGFFWLDLARPTPDDLMQIASTLGFHPLAVEDSLKFGQRPKLEDYGEVTFIVLYGYAPDEDGLVEVHVYASSRFVVTIRRDRSPAIDLLHGRYGDGRRPPERAAQLLYAIADELVDSFFPALGEFDDRLELIEDDLLARPKEEHLRDIFTMRRRIAGLRRVLAPQRDLVGRVASGALQLPGASDETERYFRDVHDHLIRLNEQIDVVRDAMSAAIDVYLSASSNRLNEVIKRLTVVATIFLPLTFVTGFFGQNFRWLVDNVGGPVAFVVLGIGSQLLVLGALLLWFKRRGWF
jgi:magnesium transporter